MKYKPHNYDKLSEMASIDVGRLTEDQARMILENIRWKDGIACPHCESSDITRINGKSDKTRDGVIQCNKCRQQFTVTVGTVMEGSHITLRQWVQAFYSICSHKKGISALQLQRNLGLGSYRSAWYLAHRIRSAMSQEPMASMLKGIVEVDETYVGGKPRKGNDIINKRGRGTRKAPVVALVERDGKAISHPTKRVNAKTLKSAIREMVDKNSTIMTDEWKSYIGIGKEFTGGHQIVNHGMGQYVNGIAHTNTAESYFALLKRGIMGTFHHISKKHLKRYCDEFSFRWNFRKTNDGERTENAIKGMIRKYITYNNLIGKTKNI
ncbi:MAG: IS1595 family transposase [Candidatus Nanoarchaeia archaeon]|nr:IS1595 family transposase [Candidatus Nanoarchaeia archaeon]